MPDANDSWYTNWATDPQQKYEDYTIKNLLAEIQSHYRTINTPGSSWIAGLSMGGFGALKFGLKSQLFSEAASFSGALDAPTNLPTEFPAFATQLDLVFGAASSATCYDNDIYKLIISSDPAIIPYIYLHRTRGFDAHSHGPGSPA
jgi:putative tributyrin esterase